MKHDCVESGVMTDVLNSSTQLRQKKYFLCERSILPLSVTCEIERANTAKAEPRAAGGWRVHTDIHVIVLVKGPRTGGGECFRFKR